VGAGVSGSHRPRPGGDVFLSRAPQSLPDLIAGSLVAAARLLAPAWRGAWAAMSIAAVLVAVRLGATGVGAVGWSAAAVLAFLVARSALWRLASRRGGLGPGGLQLGRVEARLLAVWLLGAIFLFVLALLAFVLLLCFAYAAASAGHGFVASDVSTWAPAVDGRGKIMVSVVALAAGWGMAWAATRISLAEPATVASERVKVLETWPLTRGQVLPIFVARLIVGAGAAALLTLPWRLGVSTPGGGVFGAWAARACDGWVVAGLWLPLDVGLMAYFHRSATGPESGG